MAFATRVLLLVVLAILFVGALWWWLADGSGRDIVADNDLEVVLDDDNNDNLPPSYPTGWLIAQGSNADFYYPPTLVVGTTTYVQAVDWPPALTTGTDAYECIEAGTETERAGGTEEVTVAGVDYCRTVVAEGAAGSTYRQYAYVFAHDDGTATLTFSARFPNCANYEEQEASVCEDSQGSFDPDTVAHLVARTIEWNEI